MLFFRFVAVSQVTAPTEKPSKSSSIDILLFRITQFNTSNHLTESKYTVYLVIIARFINLLITNNLQMTMTDHDWPQLTMQNLKMMPFGLNTVDLLLCYSGSSGKLYVI